MRTCLRCGRENEDSAVNCIRCGSELAKQVIQVHEPQAPSGRCFRHPKIATDLSCGRCGKFLCTKCVVLGPAGPRCKECAKNNVPIRPAAVGYSIKRAFLNAFSGMGVYKIWILLALLGFAGGIIRSCTSLVAPHRPVQHAPVERSADGSAGEQ